MAQGDTEELVVDVGIGAEELEQYSVSILMMELIDTFTVTYLETAPGFFVPRCSCLPKPTPSPTPSTIPTINNTKPTKAMVKSRLLIPHITSCPGLLGGGSIDAAVSNAIVELRPGRLPTGDAPPLFSRS